MYKGEWFNSISHLLGAISALVILVVMVVVVSLQGDPWKIVSFSIFGASLFLLYAFSTLYHSLRGRAKPVFRKLDHCAIYLLIAGTYTPFALVTLRGGWGWSIFGVIWGLAILGIVLEILPQIQTRLFSIVIYILMGWLMLVALKPLLAVLPTGGFFWLLLGGCFYTGGLTFYFLDEKVRYFHGIWHLFVLAGSICHCLSLMLYVA